jgi:hypothetical protein
VTLDAVDGQRAGQRAAPSVLDHVAEAVDGRRLADDAVVDSLARHASFSTTFDGAVDRRPFLVGGDESAIEPGAAGCARRTPRSP